LMTSAIFEASQNMRARRSPRRVCGKFWLAQGTGRLEIRERSVDSVRSGACAAF